VYKRQELYDNQRDNFDEERIDEIKLNQLIAIIHESKRGLEQEVFINL
jgi:hypothetical protein